MSVGRHIYGESHPGESSHAHGDHHTHEAHHNHRHDASSRHDGGHHLLQVERLSVSFQMYDPDEPFFKAGKVTSYALRDLSISVHVGEILGVIGASGSGKSLLADSILGIYEPNSTVEGRIWFDGTMQDARGLESLRGREIAYIPQSIGYLDPLKPVGKQLAPSGEPRKAFRSNRKDIRGEAAGYTGRGGRRRLIEMRKRELFERYGLDPSVGKLYPFELSGGMARRILLCSALISEPSLIIADEPTPGLDLPMAVKAMQDLRAFADEGGAVMLITHDIDLALGVSDRIAVFHEGTIVEETSVKSFSSPDTLRHPFSKALWHSLPENGFSFAEEDCG